jgi:hypothetical protein
MPYQACKLPLRLHRLVVARTSAVEEEKGGFSPLPRAEGGLRALITRVPQFSQF